MAAGLTAAGPSRDVGESIPPNTSHVCRPNMYLGLFYFDSHTVIAARPSPYHYLHGKRMLTMRRAKNGS